MLSRRKLTFDGVASEKQKILQAIKQTRTYDKLNFESNIKF